MKALEDRKYSKAEVEKLLREQEFFYEGNLSEKKERIFALVEENKTLKEELSAFKAKDELVGKAIVSAVQKAKEIEESAKAKFNASLRRLKVFDLKFVNYYNLIVKKYPLDDNLVKVEEFLKKMDDILGEDNMTKKQAPEKMFKPKLVGAQKNGGLYGVLEPNESGFDINEALNPSKDLEEICRELGLMQ